MNILNITLGCHGMVEVVFAYTMSNMKYVILKLFDKKLVQISKGIHFSGCVKYQEKINTENTTLWHSISNDTANEILSTHSSYLRIYQLEVYYFPDDAPSMVVIFE